MSSDTWSDIQAHKNKQLSLREKLMRRRKERQVQIDNLTGAVGNVSPNPSVPSQISGSPPTVSGIVSSSSPSQSSATTSSVLVKTEPIIVSASSIGGQVTSTTTPSVVIAPPQDVNPEPPIHLPLEVLSQVEKHLLLMLSDITLILPMEVSNITIQVRKQMNLTIPDSAIEDLMYKFAAQMLITLDSQKDKVPKNVLIVDAVDHNKLSAVTNELEGLCDTEEFSRKRKKESDDSEAEKPAKQTKKVDSNDEDVIESLLSMDSAKQRESKKMSDEILHLLSKPTAKEQSLIEKFKSVGGAQVKEFCPNGTKEECVRVKMSNVPCGKLHFRKIIHKHTDESLGDCSFLNTCFHMDSCKYVHYEIDYPEHKPSPRTDGSITKVKEGSTVLFPPEWIQCDVRKFDMSVLGKFAVIMADPPWDIHMELPYGTMGDDEMRQLQLPVMQDDGYIFLWVTGRAMELGRECLQLWGYERVDELIWVKTNQLQRIIRTGRTGHWLNHGKEHCLVGVKGNPKNMNRGLDCDVIVAEVRATSHKPDEIYGIIERLSPGTRKMELFGRPHNVQPNWVTLGNQLDGVKLSEPDVVKRYKERYPNGYTL